jgi:competence protein ComEC
MKQMLPIQRLSFNLIFINMKAMFKNLKDIFKVYPEWHRLPLFIPVSMGLGISLYFTFQIHLPLMFGLILIVSTIFLMIKVRHIPKLYWGLVLTAACFTGILSAEFRTSQKQSPQILETTEPLLIEGTIAFIDYKLHRTHFILKDLSLENFNASNTPRNIQVFAAKTFPYTLGDRISLKAPIHPPYSALLDYTTTSKRDAYYKQIGGVIFFKSLSTLYKMNETPPPPSLIEKWRSYLVETIYKSYPTQAGAVTAALITGKRDKINEETMLAFQHSGLAHLLAISGLHVGMFFAFVVFFVRAGLSLIPRIALYYSTKKIAVVIGLAAALFYTRLAGDTIPTLRSFLMLMVVALAILLDRRAISMRTLAFAATALLLYMPEALLSISFQLSFAAVMGLIAFYERSNTQLIKFYLQNFFSKILFYFLALGASSLVASLATTPFTLYHFQQFQVAGLISNLLAIPLMGILVMPFIVLSCIMTPLGLLKAPLFILEKSVNFIIELAHFVSHLPFSTLFTSPLTLPAFLLVVLLGLWLCLIENRWRFIGVLSCFVFVTPYAFEDLPDLILIKKGKGIVIQNEGQYLTNLKENTFARRYLEQKYGHHKPFQNLADSDNCIDKLCSFTVHSKHILISLKRYPPEHITHEKVDYLITPWFEDKICPQALHHLNTSNLKDGDILFDLKNDKATFYRGLNGSKKVIYLSKSFSYSF